MSVCAHIYRAIRVRLVKHIVERLLIDFNAAVKKVGIIQTPALERVELLVLGRSKNTLRQRLVHVPLTSPHLPLLRAKVSFIELLYTGELRIFPERQLTDAPCICFCVLQIILISI